MTETEANALAMKMLGSHRDINTRGVISDDDERAMLARNEEKREASIASLGVRYVMHPDYKGGIRY